MRILLFVVAMTAIVGLGLYLHRESTPEVKRTLVHTGELRISCPGRIEAATEEIELRPEISGRIREIVVQEGQAITAGEVLLRLDEEEYRHEIAAAAAEVDRARARLARIENGARAEERSEAESLYQAELASLEEAQLNWERVERLIALGSTTQQEADAARTLLAAVQSKVRAAKARLDLITAPPREDEIALAKAEVAAAEARHDLAELELRRTVLVSPISGQVLEINAEPGELGGPDSNHAPLVVADTRLLRIRAFVEELDAPRVVEGMRAECIADGLPGKVFRGRVVQMSPHMTRKRLFSDQPTEMYDTKVREVWIELEPTSEPLVIGLRVEVTIEPQSTRPAEPLADAARDSASPVEVATPFTPIRVE